MRKVPKTESDRRVAEVLEIVGLAHLRDRYPSALSGGQQQRVALARAIAPQPKLLLLDEPLSNLDAQLRRNLRTELRRIQQALGITAILVTHDREEALSMADTIAVLRNGRLEQSGRPNDVFEQPRSLFVASFIGQSNILHGTIAAVEPQELAVRIGGSTVRARRNPNLNYTVGNDVAVSIRPAQVRLGDDKSSDNRLTAIITGIERIGDAVRLSVKIAGERIIEIERYVAHNETAYMEGADISIAFAPADAWALPAGD
jgi:ABC-type Fe3+/spermidine/putrescine transport system ATPase subunit